MSIPKTKSLECSELMMYMTLSAVRDYLGLALSARSLNMANKCEISLGFVENALELVKRLEKCLGHGR